LIQLSINFWNNESSVSPAGSIPYICQPVGSVVSGLLVQLLGRKRSLILVNIPFLVGWLLICTAYSFEQLVAAEVILGVTIGLCEAPFNTYYGEISQPELRGILAGTAGKNWEAYWPDEQVTIDGYAS
jgi:MFS family permease